MDPLSGAPYFRENQGLEMRVKKLLFLGYLLTSIILFVCDIGAQEVNLSGTWKGTCFNQSFKKEAEIEVFLDHKGNKVTGRLKVYPPLEGGGPLEGWIDEEKFNAVVKCKGIMLKLFMGGATIHMEDGVINVWPESGQLNGEIKGAFRIKYGWSPDQVGVFRITKELQSKEQLGPLENTYSPVFATRESNVYHRPDCPKLAKENLIEFESSQQAREAGGIPCMHCNP